MAPRFLDNRVFGLIFDIGKVANLTDSDMNAYESSLKNKRDLEAVRMTQVRQLERAREEERAKAEAEYARKMLRSGLDISMISDITGLSAEEIEKLA